MNEIRVLMKVLKGKPEGTKEKWKTEEQMVGWSRELKTLGGREDGEDCGRQKGMKKATRRSQRPPSTVEHEEKGADRF